MAYLFGGSIQPTIEHNTGSHPKGDMNTQKFEICTQDIACNRYFHEYHTEDGGCMNPNTLCVTVEEFAYGTGDWGISCAHDIFTCECGDLAYDLPSVCWELASPMRVENCLCAKHQKAREEINSLPWKISEQLLRLILC